MKKYVKFHGKFGDLIPSGWRFFKMFSNYRTYIMNTNPKDKPEQTVYIFQHMGGYVELDDLFSNTHLVVEIIKSGRIKTFKENDG